MTPRFETFAVKGEAARSETFWETRHGFVVLGDPHADDEVLAARWALDEPGHDFDGMLALLRAHDAAEARSGLRGYDSISGNFCFADVGGDIGYQYTGRIPRRPPALVPVPGWDGEHEWDGWVPKDELPCEDNPTNGYFATANNKTTTPDYPHYLSLGAAPWRANRLNEILQSRPKFSPRGHARDPGRPRQSAGARVGAAIHGLRVRGRQRPASPEHARELGLPRTCRQP